MPAPTISHRSQEVLAFAVRIRVRMVPGAPKRLTSDIGFWLLNHIGRESFAHRRMDTQAGSPQVFYFRQLEDAQEFLDAFPDLKLANETTAQVDTSPVCLGR